MKNRKLYGLQLFAEAVAGKKIVYLYRILSTEKDHDATALAFTTENERTKSKDADSTVTKDGTVRTPGAAEGEITASSLLKKEISSSMSWKQHSMMTKRWRSGK